MILIQHGHVQVSFLVKLDLGVQWLNHRASFFNEFLPSFPNF